MTTTPDLRARLAASADRVNLASSDYDLNPEVVLPSDRKLRQAGVLIGVVPRPDGPRVILTKRSSALKHHPGQVAFPGGKVDPGDADVVAAALREAHEEVGLAPDMVEVLGTLAAHETVTGFKVTPVLAMVAPDFVAVPEVGEVDEVFEVPLDHVTDPAKFSIQSRRWRGQRRAYFTVPWGPYYIWGATARMLRALADGLADDNDHS